MSDDGKSPVRSKQTASEFKTRVVRGQPADRQFDIEYWQEQGDKAIFAAAWEMICMVEESKHGRKPTFDRTVTKVIRRSKRYAIFHLDVSTENLFFPVILSDVRATQE